MSFSMRCVLCVFFYCALCVLDLCRASWICCLCSVVFVLLFVLAVVIYILCALCGVLCLLGLVLCVKCIFCLLRIFLVVWSACGFACGGTSLRVAFSLCGMQRVRCVVVSCVLCALRGSFAYI